MTASDLASRPRVIARVDLAAIRHNLARVREYAPGCRVMAAVKADAYGHGAVAVSRALEAAGVDALAVACVEEALRLKRADLQTRIVLLEGISSAGEADWAVEQGVDIVLHAAWQCALLAAKPRGSAARVWFKLDTGMHRLGFAPAQAHQLAAEQQRRAWQLQGWMTHLACADEPAHPLTLRQLQRFETALDGIPGARSIANSAGLIDWPQARVDWVRPGIMLYGSSPFAERPARGLGLRAAMQLESFILSVRDIAAGESVGYGGQWVAPRAARIGVVAAGYADGLPRALPAGTMVAIEGQRLPLVGRVSMDMIMVDLSEAPQVLPGAPVTLWSDELPAGDMAARAGTVSYELFCRLTRRVHFDYVESARFAG